MAAVAIGRGHGHGEGLRLRVLVLFGLHLYVSPTPAQVFGRNSWETMLPDTGSLIWGQERGEGEGEARDQAEGSYGALSHSLKLLLSSAFLSTQVF